MRLAVLSAKDAQSRKVAAEAVRLVRDRHPEIALRAEPGPPTPDVLVAAGDDRFLLGLLRNIRSDTAVLAVGHGFLSEVSPDHLRDGLERIVQGRHTTEERMRLVVEVAGKPLRPALNDAALGTSRGGGFLRYALEVDGDRVWRDGGDGVVIATPTGSTGYGLSAGGPIVMENAEALIVVPVASAMRQRPLVVSRDSTVAVREIDSRVGRELVIDGQERIRLRESGFTVRASDEPVRFVRLEKAKLGRVFGKLRSRQSPSELPAGTPPSSRFLFYVLQEQGPLTEKQLITESGLPERTVRSALGHLVRGGLVRRAPSLRDAREVLFAVTS